MQGLVTEMLVRLKGWLRSFPVVRRAVKDFKVDREYRADSLEFRRNYMESSFSSGCLEYEVLLIVHSLEKGMSRRELRPFGAEKCERLVELLKRFDSESRSTSYRLGIAILAQWCELHDQNCWPSEGVYGRVREFLGGRALDLDLPRVGSRALSRAEAERYRGFDYLEAVMTRHSLREYDEKDLEEEDIAYCVEAARFTPTACNRQMCKVYQCVDSEVVALLESVIVGLGGLDKRRMHLFVVTFDVNALEFYGERNQGHLNAGLFAMNFCFALHFRGIGSCFLQWGNSHKEERVVAKAMGLRSGERIAVVLGAGYYPEQATVPVSQRKRREEIFAVI